VYFHEENWFLFVNVETRFTGSPVTTRFLLTIEIHKNVSYRVCYLQIPCVYCRQKGSLYVPCSLSRPSVHYMNRFIPPSPIKIFLNKYFVTHTMSCSTRGSRMSGKTPRCGPTVITQCPRYQKSRELFNPPIRLRSVKCVDDVMKRYRNYDLTED